MKKRIRRILISAVLFAGALIVDNLSFFDEYNFAGYNVFRWAAVVLYAAAYLTVGLNVLIRAAKNIAHGHIFDENFLMALATVGACIIGEYPEAVAVMLFYQVGEAFEKYAVGKSRKSIADIMNIRPDHAVLLKADGDTETVDPSDVKLGDTILVTAGERIPLDGSIDTSALTGESIPREVAEGDDVLSGCINLTGVLHIKVEKEYGESTVAKILELVENASSKKSRQESFITRFAAYYTPVVVILAVLLAVVPPLIIADAGFTEWIYRALNFLVVSCPCALVISVPLSFFGGIGGASKKGILIKGSNYLEALSNTEIAVFDKTGTLTKGKFEVAHIHAEKSVGIVNNELISRNSELTVNGELLSITAAAEKYSNHPISQSIRNAWESYSAKLFPELRAQLDSIACTDIEEIAGHGIKVKLGGKSVFCGNTKLMESIGVECADIDGYTLVHTAADGEYIGYIALEDSIKPDSAQALAQLKAEGVRKTVMLTGDSEAAGRLVAERIGLDEYHAKLLPADKVTAVEKLMSEKSPNGKLLFVGDGMNDAPVLARADIGAAMGGMGQDAAIEAADVVIMTDEPSKLAEAIAISRKTLRIARQNIVFALAVKVLVLVLISFGAVGMWAAVFADVGVSVIAILNAMRCG